MANRNRFLSTMLTLALLLMLSLSISRFDKQLFINCAVCETGACYGMRGNNLPSASDVVALYNQNNIKMMRIYDPNPATLQALTASNIQLMLGVPNTDLQSLAAAQSNADSWVQNNVKNYPNVNFGYIAVGNEVSPTGGTAQYVLPAMQNIYNAISEAGLGNQIKVSTAVDTGVLGNSYPPADGEFKSDVESYINPIVGFLVNTGAPLLVNIYTYFSYESNKGNINLNYALLQPNSGVTVPGGVRYDNLLYAMLDAMYSALEKSGGSSVKIVLSESGWPSAGGDSATTENARIYNNNLIERVKSGTPKRPGQSTPAFIFDMFDENEKSGADYEQHFGLFFPNEQHKYPITFS